MPSIERNIVDLAPNIINSDNPTSQSSWFSYIRRYSIDHRGTVAPPTKTEFVRAWNLMTQTFDFVSQGETFELCKSYLQTNTFPRYPRPIRRFPVQDSAWVRMILAFNMYVEVRREFELYPNNRIDFIGSMGTRSNSILAIRNKWEHRFRGRCVLYIDNEQLINLIQLINNERNQEFWQNIFAIYDNLQPLRPFRAARTLRAPRQRRPQSTSSARNLVDSPMHAIAQEYLNRIDENELDIIPDNQQIANMVLNTRDVLPYDLRKIIYETCQALHISHVI